MENYHEFAIGIALMKLEEELNLLRQIVFSLPPNLPAEEVNNLLHKGLLLMKIGSDILSSVNPEEEEVSFLKDISFAIFEALFISKTLFEKLENQIPIFWEQFTVFEEPLLEKIEQVIQTLHSSMDEIEQLKGVDFGELAYILQDAVKTLEAALLQSQQLEKKVL